MKTNISELVSEYVSYKEIADEATKVVKKLSATIKGFLRENHLSQLDTPEALVTLSVSVRNILDTDKIKQEIEDVERFMKQLQVESLHAVRKQK